MIELDQAASELHRARTTGELPNILAAVWQHWRRNSRRVQSIHALVLRFPGCKKVTARDGKI